MAAAQPNTSFSPTTRPASPMTYGISPESLPMTGTPQANASISIRPNCSFQCHVVWLGATSMSIVPRYDGTSSCLAKMIRTRSDQPRALAQSRMFRSMGPLPSKSKLPGTFAAH